MKHIFSGLISLAMVFMVSGQQATPHHPAAPPLSLTDLQGSAFSLSQYQGKVLVLNFWNADCLLCIKESATLVAFQNKYRDQGIAVVGVAYKGDAANLFEVAKQIKINYPIVLGKTTEIQSLYGIHELPALVMIGRDGRIYSQYHEYLPEASLESGVGQLLAAKDGREVVGFRAALQNSTKEATPAKRAEEDPANAGIDGLNSAQRKTFEEDLQATNCTCGCKQTFLGCMRSGMKCQLRTAAITKELGKIKGD